MEFEEMQVIWNSQNNEKLFAINEAALHKQIRRKSGSVNHLLTFFEGMMVLGNLVAGGLLMVDAIMGDGSTFQFVIAAVYLSYAVFAVIRRLWRRRVEVRFEETIVGELDKALWQIDYHIRQARSIAWWYLLPLALVVSVNFFLTGKLIWALGVLLVLVPVGYFGTRWEINKWYIPKQRELEAMRKTLLAPEVEI